MLNAKKRRKASSFCLNICIFVWTCLIIPDLLKNHTPCLSKSLCPWLQKPVVVRKSDTFRRWACSTSQNHIQDIYCNHRTSCLFWIFWQRCHLFGTWDKRCLFFVQSSWCCDSISGKSWQCGAQRQGVARASACLMTKPFSMPALKPSFSYRRWAPSRPSPDSSITL